VRNIYQRHVILGPGEAAHAGGVLAGLTGRVLRSGVEIANTKTSRRLTGELIEIVRYVANLLEFRRNLDAGQIISQAQSRTYLGAAGEEIVFHLAPL